MTDTLHQEGCVVEVRKRLRIRLDQCAARAKNPAQPAMVIRKRDEQPPFTTKDGSTIRSLLDRSNAPVAQQSLAEATLLEGGGTQRHHHKLSEEFYYILEGSGIMEIDGETREVGPGDAVLIPAGAWHELRALTAMRLLCCCAPPYSHDDTWFE
jgi:mannose-6-phosphate isomerase-like protein (cupin superfamily)